MELIMTKTCYILIGMPASGKSTWLWEQDRLDDTWVLSTDNVIEEVATQFGFTYNEAFKDLINFADKVMWQDAHYAAQGSHMVYVDRTNLSAKSRKKFIDFFKPYGYTFKAIVFCTPDETEWRRRLDSRPGKTIPEEVLKNMRRSYESPLPGEGFDEITNGWTWRRNDDDDHD
jgi:predicted kinase